jgi:hypothetical protein
MPRCFCFYKLGDESHSPVPFNEIDSEIYQLDPAAFDDWFNAIGRDSFKHYCVDWYDAAGMALAYGADLTWCAQNAEGLLQDAMVYLATHYTSTAWWQHK